MNLQTTIKDQCERNRVSFLLWDKDATKLKCKPDDLLFFADNITQQTAEAVLWAVREALEDNVNETLWGDDDSNEIMKVSIEAYKQAVLTQLQTNDK